MRIRVLDRIVAALAGLLLAAGAAIVVVDGFLGENVLAFFQRLFVSPKVIPVICKAVAVVVLLALAAGCFSVTIRHRSDRRAVSQKTENGELAISMKAIEGLVQKCVETHHELQTASLQLESDRGGLLIHLRVATGSSVSIPLVVEALQKQLKQYITACTGLEVKEVCVLVDTAQAQVAKSPFDLPDLLAAAPGAEALPAASKAEPEKKLLHQRLFEEKEAPAPVEAKAVEPAPMEEKPEEPGLEASEQILEEPAKEAAPETADPPAEPQAPAEPAEPELPQEPVTPVEAAVPQEPMEPSEPEAPEELEASEKPEEPEAEEATEEKHPVAEVTVDANV